MIFAIGELLIDFIAVEDVDLKYVKTFEKHPGGAPANMVVGLRRLGVPSALIIEGWPIRFESRPVQ